MRHRPWPLILLAIIHILSPFLNIVLTVLVMNVTMNRSVSYVISDFLTWQSVFIFILPIVAGCAIYLCKPWSFYLYLVSMVSLFGLMIYDNYNGYTDELLLLNLISIFAVSVLTTSYFFLPEVRKIYFDKKMRWWENKPRYHFNQPCQFKKMNSDSTDVMFGEILDISESGLFLKTKDLKGSSENIEITFLFESLECVFVGRTISHDLVESIGFGVEFEHSPVTQKIAKEITSRLNDQNAESRSKPKYEDTFGYWIKNMGSDFLKRK